MSKLTGFVKRLRDIMRNDAGINGDAQRIEQIAWMLFLKVYDAKEQDWAWEDENYQSIIPQACRWQNWAHDDKSGKAMTGDKLLDFVNNRLFPVLKGRDIEDSNGKIQIPGVRVDASMPISKAIVQTTFADANQYMKDGVLLRQVLNIIDELDFSDYEESHGTPKCSSMTSRVPIALSKEIMYSRTFKIVEFLLFFSSFCAVK